MPGRGIVQRWRRDTVTLVYITVPFVALAIGFLAFGKLSGAGGWDALEYLVYAMAAGVLWAVAVVGYLIWVVIRDGWQPSSFPAIAVLAVVALLAAGWAYRKHAEEADCRAAQAFYLSLPGMPAADRPAAIRQAGAYVRSPAGCAVDGLRLALGRHVLDPEPTSPSQDADRRAILAELLAAGLPPDRQILYGFAVSDADPESTRMLLRRRKALNAEAGEAWDLFPDDMIDPLMTHARTIPGKEPDPRAERCRATLAVFLEEARPDPALMSSWDRKMLAEIGLLSADPSQR